jgi:hypothetical protein
MAPAVDPAMAKITSKISGSSLWASFEPSHVLSVGGNERSFSSTSISSDTFLIVSQFFQFDSMTKNRFQWLSAYF